MDAHVPENTVLRIYTPTGQVMASTNAADSNPESSARLDDLGSHYASLDQLAQSLKVGELQELILDTDKGLVAGSRTARKDESTVIVGVAGDRLDDIFYAQQRASEAISRV